MYIRTKDGIFRAVDLHNDEHYVGLWNPEVEILAKSENLYELCDLFIDEETKTIFHKYNGYVINWKPNMVYSLKALSESYHSVKGAIYTDKGLIYVAKMNEKGELELL